MFILKLLKMFKFIVGCDMSKENFDASLWINGSPVYVGSFTNCKKGFQEFYKALKLGTKLAKKSWFICFENTGVYSKNFYSWLHNKKIPFREENALQIAKSLGIKRGKSDKIDSEDICRYAFEKRDSIKPSGSPNQLIIGLKDLLSRRDFLVKQRAANEVSVSEKLIVLRPAKKELFIRQKDELNEIFSAQIKEIEIEIKELMKQDSSMEKNNKLAQSVIGIGPVTSAYMIASTENFTSFKDSRKYCCYSGIAPFPNSSGKWKGKTKISQIGNKKIKTLLSNGVASAIRHDPELKLYFERRQKDGKENGVILNAVRNKLVHRVFATIKRQTPYVKMSTYT